eukprot:g7401.t1
MQTILEARDVILEARDATRQEVTPRGETLNRSSVLGAISDLAVLPETCGDDEQEQLKGFDDTANNKAGRTSRWGHILPAGHTNDVTSGDDSVTTLPKPSNIGMSGGRAVLATRAISGVPGSTTGLGTLEHGFGLHATAEGSIGLPEGSTLFAQRVALGRASRHHSAQYGRSFTGGDGGASRRLRGDEEGHVLLLSDRVRSRTNMLIASSAGVVAPAGAGANKGFDGDRHTVHLGRTEPGESIVQVTEDAVNVVRHAGGGVFELAASWRPPPVPSMPTSSFKVQHAGTAGTVVGVVCESTMFLVEVRRVAANLVARPTSPAASAPVQAKEVLRVELSGGPVSALGMRVLGSNGGEEESAEPTTPAPVLIATASWDSASVVVISFPALPAASIDAAKPEDGPRVDEPPNRDSSTVSKNIATWRPPWGKSAKASKVLGARGGGGGGAARLTRALAFVRFGRRSEGLSLVAATGDGAVAVAELQGEMGKGEWRRGNKAVDKVSSKRVLVTTASFQVGRGPAGLEVFQPKGLVTGAEGGVESNGGDGERVFVNGDIMDAVVRRCSDAAETTTNGQRRDRWRCTQVCRTGHQSRRSVVFLPRRETSKGRDEQAAASPPPPQTATSLPHSASCLRIFDADTLEERPGSSTSPFRLRPGVRVTGVALLPGLDGPLGAAAPNPLARPHPRPVTPAAAAAVGGDVVAVACYSCTSATAGQSAERPEGGGGGARPAAAGVTTVVAAFEVVAYRGNDAGAAAAGEEGEEPRDTADGIGDGGHEGGDAIVLAALAASPEMAGAWFGLETLGKRCVAGSADDRLVVLGWEGCEQQGLRFDKPVPSLRLAVQASCRTATGGCITALATWESFVVAAELLRGVSLYSGGIANGTDGHGSDGDGEGGAGGAAGHLRLLSVWPCRDKVTSLVAASAPWGTDPMAKRTRVTVKILEGKNLLVSDLLTGTSDPVALLWVGTCDEGEVDLKYDKRVQSTEVCHRTVDPVWDAEFVFPLEVQTVQDLLSGQLNVLVRDYDDADGDVHFVDLGRVSIPLETVLTEGNIMAHTQLVQLPARWYPLQRCRGVTKSRGALKMAVGFFVGSDSALLRDDDSESETIDQGAGTALRGRLPGASATWDGHEAAIVHAHRWQRRLLESMQRLEDRSTEGAAYGELRAMVREASSTQASQVIAAARGVGASCSLSARRYTLRLLAWLCWDQQAAASKGHGDIISYVLDRAGDNETASLRRDMAVCVGAVMLSALRHGTVDACMAQTRRFLRLVGEQQKSVRESAGVCCVASVLPPSPYVPVEIQADLRSIEDVRLVIGRAAEWGRLANFVPKEAVLLPGGRAVIELPDAAAAASFFDRITATAGGLPSSWRIDPFPEDFCARINHAQAAHHAKLTVNSEEILASLLEALGNGRSEATRGQLFDATAALAQSIALHGRGDLGDSNGIPKISAAEAATSRGLEGIPATLRKGLPAIARAVLEVLDCPVRRAYTWKERKAALGVISSLAALADLRGACGPLGEHRAKLIQGASRGKHDSVAAVREAAIEALVALEATEADEGKPEKRRPFLAPAGAGRFAGSATDMARKIRREDRGGSGKGAGAPMRTKTLDGIGRKADRAKIATAEPSPYETERRRESPDGDPQSRRKRKEQEDAQVAEILVPVPADRTPSASSVGQGPMVASNFKQPAATQTDQGNLEAPFPAIDRLESEQTKNDNGAPDRRKSTPLVPENNDPRELDGASRDPRECWSRESSEEKKNQRPQDHADTAELEERNRGFLMPPRRPDLSGANRAPADVEVCVSDKTLPQVGLSQSVQVVPQLQQDKQSAAAASGDPAGTAAKVAPCSLSTPMHGGVQVDALRLLKHLDTKTDKITSVLDGLDRRLFVVERTLVECPLASGPSTHPPPGRNLKRPRSGEAPSSRGEQPSNATPKSASCADNHVRYTQRTANLKQDVRMLLERGDVESAFRLVLSSGTERDVLRLMGKAGGPDLSRHRLGMETRNKLFAFLARTISAGQYAEHALPWVFEIVRAGETRSLSLAVRMQLAGALHGLSASPTDQGIVAARLGPYLSLTTVGRPSLSDATETAGVFSSFKLGVGACS